MSNEKFFPVGTTKCPKDGEPLHWEQLHGMRIVKKIGNHDVYQALCPKCKMYWAVKK
jgi:hypothetical protein